jgi:hypothetical protein
MVIASIAMFAQVYTAVNKAGYFIPIFLGMLLLGIVVTLIAAVLAFSRARAFGPSARWFSYATVCLLLFHIQLLAVGLGVISNDNNLASNIVAFFNFFIILGAICAIMGFVRLTNPR